MPSTPLVEPAKLDLTQVVADQAEIQRYNMQRGTFALLDGVLHEDPEDPIVVGFKDLAVDAWWTKDHIPGRPLFPGALMIEAAAQLSSYHYQKFHSHVPEGSFLGFGGIDDVRFRGVVEPGERFLIVAHLKRKRATMFVYDTQGFVNGQMIFEGCVRGVVV